MNAQKHAHTVECAHIKRIKETLGEEFTKSASLRLFVKMLVLKKVEELDHEAKNRLREKLGRKTQAIQDQSKFKECMDLVTNRDRVSKEDLKAIEEFVAQVKGSFGGLWLASDAEVVDVLLRIQCNAHTVLDPIDKECLGIGMFPEACYLNHSCVPNCVYVSSFKRNSSDTNQPVLEFRAIRDISPGEEICYSYVDLYQDRKTRNEQLSKAYLFKCACKRCTNPASDDILSSIMCPKCNITLKIGQKCSGCQASLIEEEFENLQVQIFASSRLTGLDADFSHVYANIAQEEKFKWLTKGHYLRLNFELSKLSMAKELNDWKTVIDSSRDCLAILQDAAQFLGFDTSNLPEVGALKVSLAAGLLRINAEETKESSDLIESATKVFTISQGKDSPHLANIDALCNEFGILKVAEAPKKKKQNKKGKSGKK
jgi:SET and MYND domain-containing protein